MNIGDVFLTVRANLSQFQADLAGLNSLASRSATDMGKTFTNVGKSLSGTGMAMTRNITAPLVAAGGAAAKFALDFDTAMRNIVALTDVTADQVAGITEQINALGAEVGKTPQELAEAFYFIASAGFEAEEAMNVLDTAARASAAGMGQTQDVAKVLASVINAYGHENLDAATAADQLTAAVSKGSAEAADFAGVIGRVAPGAAALGVSFDQVTAALAGMTNVGISADEAATSLVQIFSALLKPTTQAEDAMRELGLSSGELRRQLREEGLLATLRTLEERFAGNETASAAVFGNIRALRGITALLSIDTEQLNGIFAATADSTGDLAGAYADTEGPARDLGRSMARLQAAAISIGEDVLPLVVSVLEEVAKAAEGVAEWWRSLDDDTQKLVVQVLAFTAVAGPMLVIIGKISIGLGAIFKAIGFLTGAKGLPLAVTWVGRLATSLVGIPALLFAAQEAAREVGPDIAETIGGAIFGQGFVDFHRKQMEVGDSIDAAMEDWRNRTEHGVDGVEDAVNDWDFAEADRVHNRFWQRQNVLVEQSTAEAALIAAGLPPEVAAVLAEGAGEVGTGADAMMDEVAAAAAEAREAAIDHMESMLAGIAALFENDETLREAFRALLERMDDPYTEAERRADIFSRDTINVIRQALQSGDPLIVSDTRELVNNMLLQIEAMEPGALASGEAVPPAIRAGMDSQIGGLITYLEEQHGIILDELTLEEAEQLGLDGILLYAQGIEKRERDVLDAAMAAQRAALKPLEEGVAPAGRYGADTGGAFSSGINAPPNLERARLAGGDLAREAGRSAGSGWNAWQGGYDIGYAWTVGIRQAMYDSASEVGLAMGHIRALMGGSLPTAGPLQHPETGGRSIGEAWGGGLLGGLAQTVRGVGGAMGLIGSELAFQPAFAGMAGMTVPRASAVSPQAVPPPDQFGKAPVNIYGDVNLDVTDDSALDELRDLADFGSRG